MIYVLWQMQQEHGNDPGRLAGFALLLLTIAGLLLVVIYVLCPDDE
jgi:hypothetical protein